MWPFRRVPKVSPKRVAELALDVEDVQRELAWVKKALRDLNGRMATVQRQQKPAEDDPQQPIEEEVDLQRAWTPPPALSTAHLARRFRGG
jgi:hypothetical protein